MALVWCKIGLEATAPWITKDKNSRNNNHNNTSNNSNNNNNNKNNKSNNYKYHSK